MAQPHETILEWEAPEFRHYDKNIAWYITLLVIVLLLVAYMVINGDYFGAISLAIISGFIWVFAKHKPSRVPITISDQGIHLNETQIPYDRIKHFWVVDDDQHRALNFETTAYLNHIQTVELDDQDPELVRAVLNELLPEHSEIEPTTAQKLAHRFRF